MWYIRILRSVAITPFWGPKVIIMKAMVYMISIFNLKNLVLKNFCQGSKIICFCSFDFNIFNTIWYCC